MLVRLSTRQDGAVVSSFSLRSASLAMFRQTFCRSLFSLPTARNATSKPTFPPKMANSLVSNSLPQTQRFSFSSIAGSKTIIPRLSGFPCRITSNFHTSTTLLNSGNVVRVKIKRPRHLQQVRKESIVVKAATNTWLAFVLAVTGSACMCLVWYLFSGKSGYSIYAKSFDFLQTHPHMIAQLGSPIKSLASFGRRPFAQKQTSPDGSEVFYKVVYYITGPFERCEVTAVVREVGGKLEYDELKVHQEGQPKPIYFYYNGCEVVY